MNFLRPLLPFFIALVVCSVSFAIEIQKLDFGKYIGAMASDGNGRTDGFIGSPEEMEKGFGDTWHFDIRTDAMTDKKRITSSRTDISNNKSEIFPFFDFSNPNSEILCIIGHKYPGRTGMIRIDKNAAITTNEDGCVHLNQDLDLQLKKGNKITLRGHIYPNGHVDQTFSLDGYTVMSGFLRKKR